MNQKKNFNKTFYHAKKKYKETKKAIKKRKGCFGKNQWHPYMLFKILSKKKDE